MSRRSIQFTITGSTSISVMDGGIQSEEGEAVKTLVAVKFKVSAYNGAIISCYEGQTQKQGAYDYNFAGYVAIASMTPANSPSLEGFDVNVELGVGKPFRVQVGAASTATVIYGQYIYDQDER